MKKKIISLVIAGLFAVPAFAIDNALVPIAPVQNFEQHKAELLKRIDERIARSQEEKSCVQAAQNQNDIKACREKIREEVRDQRQKKQ